MMVRSLKVENGEWWRQPELMANIRMRFAPHQNPIWWGGVAGLVGLIVEMRNRLGEGSDFKLVELGSYNGESGAMFAGSGMFAKIYLIDRWKNRACEGICEYNMRAFGGKVQMLKGEVDAYAVAWSELVDAIYIDADHGYEPVKNNLEMWWQHLRPGGVMTGHDYNTVAWPGVVTAVDEFAVKRGLEVVTFLDKSWLMQKPKESYPVNYGDEEEYNVER